MSYSEKNNISSDWKTVSSSDILKDIENAARIVLNTKPAETYSETWFCPTCKRPHTLVRKLKDQSFAGDSVICFACRKPFKKEDIFKGENL